MTIKPIPESLYQLERRLVDLDSEWSEQFRQKNGWIVIPADTPRPPEIEMVDNAMRGRVEQYELLRDTPERLSAYIGSDGRSVTVWTGLPLGSARETAAWRVNSYIGSHMRQFECRIAGKLYTGRGFGSGCCINLKRKKESR